MANQVRIEYDPYLQKASYQTRASSSQKFNDIPKSDLGNPDNRRYHDGALDEILKYAIPELQAKRLAKELIFCGTEDDFQDFQDALARFYERMPDTTWNMTLVRDETADYRAADVVKEEINVIFQGIVDTLAEQQNKEVYQEVSKKLASYSDAVSDEIPVCVVGVYSAGKSAFLNAIIGREILPSHDRETTAKITKIIRSHATRIRFAYKGAEVCLRPDEDKTLENSEYAPELAAFLDQLGEIDRTLPEDQRVYQMIPSRGRTGRGIWRIAYDFFNSEQVLQKAERITDAAQWMYFVRSTLEPKLTDLSQKEVEIILAMIVCAEMQRHPEHERMIYCLYKEESVC